MEMESKIFTWQTCGRLQGCALRSNNTFMSAIVKMFVLCTGDTRAETRSTRILATENSGMLLRRMGPSTVAGPGHRICGISIMTAMRIFTLQTGMSLG